MGARPRVLLENVDYLLGEHYTQCVKTRRYLSVFSF